jgi:hypothetical protein
VKAGMFERSVAISSMSLITLKRLFGIEPRTIIDCLPFPLPVSFHYTYEMISRHIAGVQLDFGSTRPEFCNHESRKGSRPCVGSQVS